jgi:hypothetical protein
MEQGISVLPTGELCGVECPVFAVLHPKIVTEGKVKQTVDPALPWYLIRPGQPLLNWFRPFSKLWRKCAYGYVAMVMNVLDCYVCSVLCILCTVCM